MKLKEIDEKIEKAKSDLEKYRKMREDLLKEFTQWEPLLNGKYYYAKSTGEVSRAKYELIGKGFSHYDVANMFETYEEAINDVEETIVRRELKRYAIKDLSSLEAGKPVYTINYDLNLDQIEVFRAKRQYVQGFLFKSNEVAELAIETIGEDRLKKYYFNVHGTVQKRKIVFLVEESPNINSKNPIEFETFEAAKSFIISNFMHMGFRKDEYGITFSKETGMYFYVSSEDKYSGDVYGYKVIVKESGIQT